VPATSFISSPSRVPIVMVHSFDWHSDKLFERPTPSSLALPDGRVHRCQIRKLLQSSERTARHSAVLDWHSDKLFERPAPPSLALPDGRVHRCQIRKLLQSSERTARHSAVLDWHSDKLFERPAPPSLALPGVHSALVSALKTWLFLRSCLVPTSTWSSIPGPMSRR
jgi:hypothetical protein